MIKGEGTLKAVKQSKRMSAVVGLSLIGVASQALAAASDYHNGSYGEGTFQNNWQNELPHADTAAVKFRQQVDNNTATRFGTYNMHGTAVPGLWHD